MEFQFSQKLIEDTIRCFKEENDVEITPKTANEYLESFAKLYLVFYKS